MIARVIVDISASEVDRVFDYEATDGVERGSRVLVPFGKQNLEGFVIGLSETSDVPPEKLKRISGVIDDRPIVSDEFLGLCDFMTERFHLRKIDVFRLFLPAKLRGGRIKALEKILFPFRPSTPMPIRTFL